MNGYQDMMSQPQGGVPIMPSGTPQITPALEAMVQREMRNPTGLMPLPQLYALNSLIQRLKNSTPVQQPQTNVAQDLAATADQMMGRGQQPPQMLAQGQPAPEETQMMARGGIAELPSYNFMPHNYEHGGIVAFEEGGASRAEVRNAQVAAEQEIAAEKAAEKAAKKSTWTKRGPTVGAAAKTVGAGLKSLLPFAGPVGTLATLASVGNDAIESQNVPTEAIRKFYGTETDDPSLAGDVINRLRAFATSYIPGVASPFDNAEMAKFSPAARAAAAGPAGPAAAADPAAAAGPAAADLDARIRGYMAGVGRGEGAGGKGGSAAQAGLGSLTTAVSPHDAGLKNALAKQQTELDEAKTRAAELRPKERSVFEAEEATRYKEAGIGKAAEAEQARIEKRAAGLGEESKAAFWNDLAKAGFKMAARAGARGKDATNFFGALAAGGEDFAESNIKTASKFQALQEDLAEKKSKLAVANEAVKMNRMDKADALYKDAQRDYTAANKDVLNFGTRMTETEVSAYRALKVADIAHTRAVEVAKIQADARSQDKNSVQRQLAEAYRAAFDKNDRPAMTRILETISNLTGATIGFGAGARQGSAADALRARFFEKNPMLMLTLSNAQKSQDLKKIQSAQAAISTAASMAGIELGEGGGGGSDNSNWSVIR